MTLLVELGAKYVLLLKIIQLRSYPCYNVIQDISKRDSFASIADRILVWLGSNTAVPTTHLSWQKNASKNTTNQGYFIIHNF